MTSLRDGSTHIRTEGFSPFPFGLSEYAGITSAENCASSFEERCIIAQRISEANMTDAVATLI